MQPRLLLFIFAVVGTLSTSLAQPTQNFTNKVIVNYQLGSSGSSTASSNEIIKLLSEGNGKMLRNTLFTVAADQTLTPLVQPASIQVSIKNKALVINGDVLYRGFDFTPELSPASIAYTLKVTATGFNKEFELKANVTNGKPADNTETVRDSGKRNFTYSIVNYRLIYTSSNVSAVKEKAKLVDQYFAKTSFLDQNFALLQTIDPYDLAAFRTLFPRLDQAQHAYDEVVKADLLNALHAGNNDPARLNEKLTTYNSLLQNKRALATQVYSTLHLVFYERGNDAMRDGNNKIAYDLYHASLEVNPAFAPSMLQLARIDFIRGELKEAQCKADEIIYRMLPDPATRSNTIDLLRNIKDSYVDQGLSSVGYKRYNQALDLFATAKDLCSRYPEMQCNDEINKGVDKAHHGIYSDYLQDARLSLAKNDFPGAEKKIGQAINYYHDNLDGEPSEAFAMQTALRQKQYDNLCTSGRQLSDRGDYENAVKNFTEADNLQRQYGLQKSADFEKQSRTAAGKYIAVLLTNGENAVKLNNVPQARNTLQELLAIQSQFALTTDQTINKRADALRSKIFTQQCLNAQFSIDSATTAARIHTQLNLYLPAMLVLENGIRIKQENADCKLSTDSLEAFLARVRPAGKYLQLMENSGTAIQKGDYKEALRNYNEADEWYNAQSVATYGIRHIADRDEYVLQSGDNGMLNYCATLDMQNGKLENSLRLYKLLLNKGYDPSFLSDSLYELGRKTGKLDHSRAPGGKAKKLALRYTQDDKRLKRFVKGYTKGYR